MTDILMSLPSTEPLLSVKFLTRNSNNRHSYCDWSFTYMYVYLLYDVTVCERFVPGRFIPRTVRPK